MTEISAEELQNDIITWTLESARSTGEERNVRNVAKRMLLVSFASTHTSAVVGFVSS